MQARFNTQRNLTQNLQCKFDDISNSAQDDNVDSSPPPKKRGRRSRDATDPDAGEEDAETEEIKRPGR